MASTDLAAPRVEQTRRRDGDLMLTGRAEYLDDLEPAGTLHMAVLRSPHPHARLRAVDAAPARRCRGVRAVVTGTDALELAGPLPHTFDPTGVGGRTADFRVLAVDEVRFVGDPVAVVVADSLADAEAAAEAIRVDYEELPAVVELDDALAESAPLVFADWGENVMLRLPYSAGDADAAMARSPHVLRDEFRFQRYQAAPLEPRGYLADWAASGKLTVHASTQNPHMVRATLSRVLDVPEARIRVVATRLGGAFGHKFAGYPEEVLVCLLSRAVGAPVKWVESRAEALLVGAREFAIDLAVGFDDTGRILAVQGRVLGNIGCLSTWSGWGMMLPAGMLMPGPYDIPHCAIDTVAVVTNKPPWNGARGYGKEAPTLALERMVDLVAEHLALDPVRVRMRNFVPPDAFPYWSMAKHLDSGDYPGALTKVVRLSDYDRCRERQRAARAEGRLHGVGVAFELSPEGADFAGSYARGFDTSTVRVSPTGGITVLTGVTSPGTGNETSIAALVATAFGLPVDTVSVVQGDTDACPVGFGNSSSRSLTAGGAAAVRAARTVRERMARAAAVVLGVPADGLIFAGGQIASDTARIGFAEVADQVYRNAYAIPGLDEPLLEATAVVRPLNSSYLPDEQGRMSGYPNYSYSTHVCVVEVDAETGRVEVLEYTAVDDCGVRISPVFVAGQLYGGIVMGVGGALFEQLPFDAAGRPLARTFKHYLVPRAADVPDIRLGHQVTPSPFTLLGTKGAGESGLSGAVACVANAVNDALRPLGVRIHRMPLSAPRVLAAIRSGGAT